MPTEAHHLTELCCPRTMSSLQGEKHLKFGALLCGDWLGCPQQGMSWGSHVTCIIATAAPLGAAGLCLARTVMNAACIILHPNPEVAILSLPGGD